MPKIDRKLIARKIGVVNDLKIDQRTSIIGYIDQSLSISTER